VPWQVLTFIGSVLRVAPDKFAPHAEHICKALITVLTSLPSDSYLLRKVRIPSDVNRIEVDMRGLASDRFTSA